MFGFTPLRGMLGRRRPLEIGGRIRRMSIDDIEAEVLKLAPPALARLAKKLLEGLVLEVSSSSVTPRWEFIAIGSRSSR
jgi:hypothetical protein